MRICPYCGKEYPDDVTQCAVDGQPLAKTNPVLQATEETKEAANEKPTYLTFPDYQWSARDAWKYLGMLLVFGLVVGFALFPLISQFPGFRRWYASGFGIFSGRFLDYALGLLVAAYFARTETLATFLRGFGLDRKPTENAWFGVAIGLIIRLFGHFMHLQGAGTGVPEHASNTFNRTLDLEQYLLLAPALVLAPLFEESMYRGFLYKAFRRSYSMGISMVLIVALTAFTHWPQYSHSFVTAFDLSILTVVQCGLREKSDSLWDCILCHLAYNWTGLFIDGILR